jgi:hypothetical protein
MLGAEPVAWLVIVTSFTAVAVLTNLMYSLFESSSIAPPLSTTISLPFVSKIPDNVGV